MEAIILAGGAGTRLGNILRDIPKPMAPVNGKPFLEYILEWLVRNPVSRIIISSGYKAETISGYFGSSFAGMPVDYVVEKEPLGTGGAISYALAQCADDDVMVLNGDTYFPADVQYMFDFHTSVRSKITLALKRMEKFDRYGTVVTDGNKIVKFNEKEWCEAGLINGGIYIIDRQYFSSLSLPAVYSFEKEFLEPVVIKGIIHGVTFNAPFIDIGIPEDYFRAGEFISSL